MKVYHWHTFVPVGIEFTYRCSRYTVTAFSGGKGRYLCRPVDQKHKGRDDIALELTSEQMARAGIASGWEGIVCDTTYEEVIAGRCGCKKPEVAEEEACFREPEPAALQV